MKFQELSLLIPIFGLSGSDSSTSNPLYELRAPAVVESGVHADIPKDLSLPVALESQGLRDERGRIQPVSKWKSEQINSVIELLKNSTPTPQVLEELYKGALLIIHQEPSTSQQLAYLESLNGTHLFAQLACYAGLSNTEIATLTAYIHALSEFGNQKQQDLKGWLNIPIKGHQRISKRILAKIDPKLQAGLSDQIVEALIALELHADAKELFVARRGRVPAEREEGVELLYDLVRRKFFLESPSDQASYLNACRDIADCGEERQELLRLLRVDGQLPKNKQRRLELLDEKISEAQKTLSQHEEQLAPLLEKEVDRVPALTSRIGRIEKYAPIAEIRRKMNAPERDS